MHYNISLNHGDFILLIDVLSKCQDSGLISWSATALVCENTKISFEK